MNLSELKQRYAAGESPSDVIAEIFLKIREWDDPAMFIHLPEEDVLEIARQVEAMPRDLPLWGVPFAVKDNIDVANWPTTAACPEYSYLPTADSETVRLLREAGAIPIGKTNLDQFATGLVGTRSPHGVPRNAIAPGFLPGGSSSGSACAVAAELCVFSLGTDTAGSGRVPAAFQELLGYKPTRGLLSTRGVVPACRSLDCVSVFSNNAHDAAEILKVLGVYDEADPFSRTITQADCLPQTFRFGVPQTLDFSDDTDTPRLFEEAVQRLVSLGGKPVSIDLTPFTDAAKLLYEGPWVAERWAAVGEFVERHADAVFPVTRTILTNSKNWDAATTFKAQYRLKELARVCEAVWKNIDVMLLPTTPRLYTVEENLADPIATNSVLGRYTNFMNLLDLCAVAVPAGRARSGIAPWGVTFAALPGSDFALLDLAARWQGESISIPSNQRTRIPIVVCGAHMEGLALHWQLKDRNAFFRQRTTTAACYRLFAMPGNETLPPRPALIRDEAGAAIAVEVWELHAAEFGDFVSRIPAPLGIGKVKLADGNELPGFIAEPCAMIGAEEITSFGGWRAWLERGIHSARTGGLAE
jgi:allophanate hydrolase